MITCQDRFVTYTYKTCILCVCVSLSVCHVFFQSHQKSQLHAILAHGFISANLRQVLLKHFSRWEGSPYGPALIIRQIIHLIMSFLLSLFVPLTLLLLHIFALLLFLPSFPFLFLLFSPFHPLLFLLCIILLLPLRPFSPAPSLLFSLLFLFGLHLPPHSTYASTRTPTAHRQH